MTKHTLLITLLLLLGLSPLTAQSRKKIRPQETNPDLLTQHADIYCDILKELEIGYVDTLDHSRMLKASLNAMLAQLDPYTQYIPVEDNEFLKRMSSGKYGGVGSVITQMDKLPYFSEPYEGKPAAVAGIRAGDQILEIDGVKCQGLEISKVSDMLRGTPGTKIKVRVKRIGHNEPLTFEFERQTVQMPTISHSALIAPGTGYIRIEDFIDRTAFDFSEALSKLVAESNITRLIIDLRDNGGGLVDQAIRIGELFVPRGTKLLEMKGKHDKDCRSYATARTPLYPKMRLIFLVNENTASASEILAGSLQDLDRAVIVGEQSFGKGLVQQIHDLPYDNNLKLTVAKYYLPSGRCIQRTDTSLIQTFRTRHGRTVESGSGITPDTTLTDESTINISDYLYVSNMYFRFANSFQAAHPTIAPLDSFEITGEIYNQFRQFVLEQNFTYTLQSEKYLNQLHDMVEQEGYGQISDTAFAMMREALKPNVARDLDLFRKDISQALAIEIVKRYYYQRGTYALYLRTDAWAHTAADIIGNERTFKQLLK